MSLHSPASLKKSDQAYLAFRDTMNSNPVGPVEVEPIMFDGALWTITGIAPHGTYAGQFRVDGGLARPLAVIPAPDMCYPSAYVENGTVFVFGTSVDHKRISVMRSTDLLTWTPPVVVYTAPSGMGFFNTSVARNPVKNRTRMIVETQDTAYPSKPFVAHFLKPQTMEQWTMLPHVFSDAPFVNCPTIAYIGDTLYMLYMTLYGDQHITFAARSFDDGVTWGQGLGADGETAAFVPSAGEGNNNSDVALVEHNGQTYFTYGRGNQLAWLECATAVYPGTMKQYFEQFFPVIPNPTDPQNLIPPMTGPSTGGVTVAASSVHAAGFAAWFAADRNAGTFWHCDPNAAYPHWWSATFAAPESVMTYSIKCRAGLPEQGPKNFAFQGWSGSAWVTLDTQENQTYANGVAKLFTLPEPVEYAAFRLLISANVEGSVNLSFGEVEIIGA